MGLPFKYFSQFRCCSQQEHLGAGGYLLKIPVMNICLERRVNFRRPEYDSKASALTSWRSDESYPSKYVV
ncbi:hypothetical protein BDD43_0633 [Mucilaginibacter gracilis]|uniref:Uncharacterized protein n=1 Tax=Mucilaginibacter gracilis TaxID=423350 RepID=A0A495IVL1_9SPHI|nr:hypothetical protein BDD43_0633 [Mucilaginibacter gracilis]